MDQVVWSQKTLPVYAAVAASLGAAAVGLADVEALLHCESRFGQADQPWCYQKDRCAPGSTVSG